MTALSNQAICQSLVHFRFLHAVLNGSKDLQSGLVRNEIKDTKLFSRYNRLQVDPTSFLCRMQDVLK